MLSMMDGHSIYIWQQCIVCVSILMAPFSRLFYIKKPRAGIKSCKYKSGIISRGNRVELLLYTATLPNLAISLNKFSYKTFTIKDKTMYYLCTFYLFP